MKLTTQDKLNICKEHIIERKTFKNIKKIEILMNKLSFSFNLVRIIINWKAFQQNNILIYTNEDGNVNVEVLYSDENIWLNTEMISRLFGVERPAVTKHVNNIYEQEELNEDNTCSILEHMGKTGQKYKTKYYNLDMIISIGFRINSKKAILFRTWANKIIKEYIIQGFALDDNRFLKGKKADKEYFDRLLERIKLIRVSERMFYQKITDIFSECSIDYNRDRDSEITKNFIKQYKINFIMQLLVILLLK